MTPTSSTRASAPDLRERRRRELARVIAAAAVDLFERNGFTETTIDEIAAAAGISRTTFFRHCATKEAAVLVDDAGLEVELVDIATRAPAGRALQDLADAWEAMTGVFDDDPAGRDRFLRVRRLMKSNPALLAAGLARDAQLTDHLAAALAARDDVDEIDARAIATVFASGMRLAFDEWTRRADAAPDAAPPALSGVYRDARAALARAQAARG